MIKLNREGYTTLSIREETRKRLERIRDVAGCDSYDQLFLISIPVMESLAEKVCVARTYLYLNQDKEESENE